MSTGIRCTLHKIAQFVMEILYDFGLTAAEIGILFLNSHLVSPQLLSSQISP